MASVIVTERSRPAYAFRLADLPEELRVGDDGTRRALKAVYNAHIAHVAGAEAVSRALAWGKRKGLVA
jgi:hypothetical protein